jgi:hypothetical protein
MSRWSRWVLVLGMSAACSSSDDTGNMTPGVTGPGMAGGQAPAPLGGSGAMAGNTGSGDPVGGGASGTNSEPGGTAGSGEPVGGGMPVENGVPGLAIPPECQGIQFKDIVYSPGGNALPNVCEPFHATTNNPYAVRCVDAWPGYDTGYAGDQYCILPPPPDKGVQYGFHPHGDADAWLAPAASGDMSGYQNLTGTPWELGPGMETELNYVGGTDNPEQRNYYRAYVRMRLGSHHMINSVAGTTRGSWGPGGAGGLGAGSLILPGAQRPDENRPNSLEKPAEDAGLYKIYPANATVTFNVHHFNSSDEPILREAWVNIWWEEDATIEIQGITAVPFSQAVLLNIGPGTTTDLHYSYSVSEPVRVLEMYGHRHAWTPNFSAWLERENGETEIVYQSFDWFDVPTYRYDSLTQNPVPAPEQRVNSGSSGILMLNPGEKLHFNCHIAFTDERAAATGAPSPASIGMLRFANEAYNAEMCILFGWADGPVGLPTDEFSPPPSFATVE